MKQIKSTVAVIMALILAISFNIPTLLKGKKTLIRQTVI